MFSKKKTNRISRWVKGQQVQEPSKADAETALHYALMSTKTVILTSIVVTAEWPCPILRLTRLIQLTIRISMITMAISILTHQNEEDRDRDRALEGIWFSHAVFGSRTRGHLGLARLLCFFVFFLLLLLFLLLGAFWLPYTITRAHKSLTPHVVSCCCGNAEDSCGELENNN